MEKIESVQLQPIKPARWALYTFLTIIPLVGLILLLVWAFGDGARIEKRNWARGQLLLMLIIWGLVVLFTLLFILLGGLALMKGVASLQGV